MSTLEKNRRMTYPAGRENEWVGDDIMGLYIHDTKKNPRLESEDLNLYAKTVQMSMNAQEMLAGDSSLSEQMRMELQELVEEGKAARNQIIVANTGLVFKWANAHRGRGVDPEDLIQAGNMGLMRAAEKFDPDKGFTFGTYAVRWIRAMVAQCVHENSRTISIPRNESETLSMLKRIRQEHENETGEKMSIADLAEKSGKTVEKVEKLFSMEKLTTSLHQIYATGTEHEDYELLDRLVDNDQPAVADIVSERVAELSVVEGVQKLLAATALNDDSKRIIRLKYGFETGEPMDMVQVAKAMGWHRTKTTKHAKKAEATLREEALERGLDVMGDIHLDPNE